MAGEMLPEPLGVPALLSSRGVYGGVSLRQLFMALGVGWKVEVVGSPTASRFEQKASTQATRNTRRGERERKEAFEVALWLHGGFHFAVNA